MAQDPKTSPAFVDPILKEQFEIQMRSQYKWQANNTWLYWPFLALSFAILVFGLANFAFALVSEEWFVNVMVGAISTLVGGVGVTSLWSGYKTAREMAIKLKQAEAKGR